MTIVLHCDTPALACDDDPRPPTLQGLPFRGLAEKIGDIVMPAMKVSRIRSRRDFMMSALVFPARVANQQRARCSLLKSS